LFYQDFKWPRRKSYYPGKIHLTKIFWPCTSFRVY
jgi:hypothetical protein